MCSSDLWSALVKIVAGARPARTSREISATCAFTTPAEQDQIAGHDFRHVFLLTRLLVIPRAGLQAAFDVDLATLFQILAGDFGQALPKHDIVPFGEILPLTSLVLKGFIGGDSQFSHGRALRYVFDFWILAQIANELNAVQTFSSHVDAPLQGFTITEWDQ